VLIAVAAQQVGVDVEQQPTGCVCTMSADMNVADAEWGRSLSEAGRHELVIRWWVRSEAVLKCTGEGIGHEVGEFPVLGRPGAPSGLAGPGGPDQLVPAIPVHGCSLISLQAPAGYQAALALAGNSTAVRLGVQAPWAPAARAVSRGAPVR
jgi:phosphopantetheinyl transferase